jgi:acyl carrier protein
MDRTQLRQALAAILEEEKGEKIENLDDDLNLRDNLGMDSVDLITMVMAVQTRFHIDLGTEELEKIQKIGDLLDVIQAKVVVVRAAA